MSWNIESAGTKEHVTKVVQEAPGYGDISQMIIAKKLILVEVAACPDKRGGVYVKAYGHHDDHNRQLTIEVRAIE